MGFVCLFVWFVLIEYLWMGGSGDELHTYREREHTYFVLINWMSVVLVVCVIVFLIVDWLGGAYSN